MVISQTDKNIIAPSIMQLNSTMNSANITRNNFMNSPASTYRSGSNGMTWGSPTWMFLHTIAEKIKDEHFSKLRNELLKNIYDDYNNKLLDYCHCNCRNQLRNLMRYRDFSKIYVHQIHRCNNCSCCERHQMNHPDISELNCDCNCRRNMKEIIYGNTFNLITFEQFQTYSNCECCHKHTFDKPSVEHYRWRMFYNHIQ